MAKYGADFDEFCAQTQITLHSPINQRITVKYIKAQDDRSVHRNTLSPKTHIPG